MALRSSRPYTFQDENAQANLISGKAPLHEAKGLQQQQQQHQQQGGLAERKKLSNITNQVLSQPKLSGKASADKDRFSIRTDAQESGGLPTVKKVQRPPLKNISNGTTNSVNNSSSRPPLKTKTDLKPQNQSPAPGFQIPSVTRKYLTEEMKKKAAIWAQEGIERVHCTGDDMEKQRCLMRDEEIAKRVAMIRNCRIDIPFPKFPTPYVPELGSTWEPPGDILESDVLKDLVDEETVSKDEGFSLKTIEELLEKLDYSALRSPPRFTEGWPQVKDYDEIKCD